MINVKFSIVLILFCIIPFSYAQRKTIEIIMDDYSFEPDSITVKAGEEVELKFKNVGDAGHEFMAGNKITGNMDSYRNDLFEGIEVEKYKNGNLVKEEHREKEHHGTMIELEPGDEGSLVFRLPESKKGEWSIGCFIDFGAATHYELGMHGKLIVK